VAATATAAAAAAAAEAGEMTVVVEVAVVTRGALATCPDSSSLFSSTFAPESQVSSPEHLKYLKGAYVELKSEQE
jgi:hypothetical protein